MELLTRGDDGDGNGEDLSESPGKRAEDKFERRRELDDGLGSVAGETLEGPVSKPTVKEEVCEFW